MSGGTNGDTFVFTAGFGNDTIVGFDASPTGGQGLLDISAFGITASHFTTRVEIVDTRPDIAFTIDRGSNQTILLRGVTGTGANVVTAEDFLLFH